MNWVLEAEEESARMMGTTGRRNSINKDKGFFKDIREKVEFMNENRGKPN